MPKNLITVLILERDRSRQSDVTSCCLTNAAAA